VVDGLKLYEDLIDGTEVSKLVSLVNDLRVAGKRGQFQGKCTVSHASMLGGTVTAFFKLSLICMQYSVTLTIF